MKLTVVLLLAIPQRYAQPEDITAQYIDLSMELTTAMKGTGADEAELHQLAKDVVYHGDDQGKVQKLYDAYMQNKSEEIKEAFVKNFLHDKRIEYVKDRISKVLGYYLTKEQIKNVRMVLEREAEKGSTQDEIIADMKKELMKEISERKAERALERVIKDLRILGKRYVGWMEKAEKFFFTLIKHDEH
ncbi:hypothetical protein Y032_0149g2704 [Ancylostoma ceylanicum]|nr:hypothetical protein Y032_0149g2704 [Ancylostoma ceylanicum]